MTFDECMAKALAAIDEQYTESVYEYEDALRANGHSDEEIEIAVANQVRSIAKDRARLVIEMGPKLAELVAWAKRGGRELN